MYYIFLSPLSLPAYNMIIEWRYVAILIIESILINAHYNKYHVVDESNQIGWCSVKNSKETLPTSE